MRASRRTTRPAVGTARAFERVHARFHPHMLARMRERGATESEVLATIASGERFAAPWGRTGFRKRIRAARGGPRDVTTYAEPNDDVWLVLTVVVTARARKGRTA